MTTTVPVSEQRHWRTFTSALTKSNGSPYHNTVSTNTLRTRTWIKTITPSLHPVRHNLSVSPQTLFSSSPIRSNSLASSSLPPSLNLKSRGTHFFSLALCTNSGECFLNVVTV